MNENTTEATLSFYARIVCYPYVEMRGIEPLSKQNKVIIVVLYAYLISTNNIFLLFNCLKKRMGHNSVFKGN
jgi:hypothetical protein